MAAQLTLIVLQFQLAQNRLQQHHLPFCLSIELEIDVHFALQFVLTLIFHHAVVVSKIHFFRAARLTTAPVLLHPLVNDLPRFQKGV